MKTTVEKSAIEKAHSEAMLNLRTQQAELEKKHEQFKVLHLKHPDIFLGDYSHEPRFGLYTNTAHEDWGYFCGVCLPKGRAAQVRICHDGWHCDGCNKHFYDPDYKSPPQPLPKPPSWQVFRP
jgi:hypothetical protein